MPDTASNVIEQIEWLENDFGYQELKTVGERYREIYHMTEEPDLPTEETRGTVVLQNSPFIGELSDQIVAQVLGYAVTGSVQPLGGLSDAKADTYEQWFAMWLAKRNPGDSLRAKAYRRWLTQTHTVWLLSCGGADEDDPWDVRLPLLKTCFFEPQDAPWFRPPVLGRKSKVLMREAEDKYSDMKGEHDHAGERFFFDKDGKPKYQAMSAELPGDAFSLKASPEDKYGKEVMLYQLWDEEYETHVIKGLEDKGEGTVVYQTKNYTGGVPAIIVPSVLTDDEEIAKNYRPGLWSGFNYTKQINRGRALRATKAERTVPHIFRILPPEIQNAITQVAAEQLSNPSALEAGSANIIDMKASDVKFWTPIEDKEAELREQTLIRERDAYAASWRLPTSPDVVQDGTVGVYQMAAQAVHSRETPLLKGAWDFPMAEMGKMAFHSRGKGRYENEYSLTAERKLEYGEGKEVSRGKSATLNKDDTIVVYGAERNISVQVTTKSQTEAEKRLAIQQAVYDESVGIGTRPETLGVKYTNVSEQQKREAEDLGFKFAAPFFEQQGVALLTDYYRLAGGAFYQIGAPVNTGGVGGSDVAGQGPRPMPEMGGGEGGSMGGGSGEMVAAQ